MKNKSKTYMIIGISILIIAIIGSTFAYYIWNTTTDEETKIVTNIGAATVYFDGGSAIDNANIRPVSDKSKGIVKEIGVKASTNGISMNLYLDINTLPDALKEESFKYSFYKGSTLIKEGNFTASHLSSNTEECTTNNTTHIILLPNQTVSTSLTNYTLYIWIDGANYENPTTMMNQTFSFNLHATGTGGIIKEGQIPDISQTVTNSLAHQLVQNYIEAEKTDVTNNGVLYHYDTSHNLMTDTIGNLRYYGASPNNYIYFNCSDYSNQSSSTCETWRIIGVFEGKVKIMRNSIIGSLAWDQDKNINSSVTTYDNDWSTASLQVLLNQKYYNGDTAGTVTYYSGSDGSTSTNLNMSSIGIKNDTTRNLISDTVYYLGGHSSTSVYSDQIYGYERETTVYSGRPTTWTGKIALPYPSDYGYAADLGSCTVPLGGYNNSICTSANWMKNIVTNNGYNYGWLLTRNSGDSNYAWRVYSSGNVDYSDACGANLVVPVLYLGSELGIESGTGTNSDPYKLSVS